MKKINELFFYTFAPFINLPAGGSNEKGVTIGADADFILSDIFAVAFPTGTFTGAVQFLMTINDGTNNKDYSNALVLSSLIAVTSAVINPLPVYRLLKAQTTQTLKVTNPTGAAIDIYCSLRGYKIPRDSASMVNLQK